MSDDAAEIAKPKKAPASAMGRIASLDVLRGVAVLGILYMNIQHFSMIEAAYSNPMAYGDLTGMNFVVWLIGYVFFDQKFMTLFSMLFGAGIVVMTTRLKETGRPILFTHYRRMFVLLGFGLAHAYGLWAGDILYHYSVCGMIVYWARRWNRWVLAVLGLIAIAGGGYSTYSLGMEVSEWPPGYQLSLQRQFEPPEWQVENEIEIFRGSWWEQMEERADDAWGLQTDSFFFYYIWRVGGLMLLGMAFYKFGILSARRSRAFYWATAILGFGIGLPIVVYGAWRHFEAEWYAAYSWFLGDLYNYGASLLVAFGWISVVMLLCLRFVRRETIVEEPPPVEQAGEEESAGIVIDGAGYEPPTIEIRDEESPSDQESEFDRAHPAYFGEMEAVVPEPPGEEHAEAPPPVVRETETVQSLFLIPFAAVGQMALTNYLMQTVICTTIFYGHGFGLFGSVSRVQQLGIAVTIWLLQLAYSPLWLRFFKYGPMEWLWRCLTYFTFVPIRRA